MRELFVIYIVGTVVCLSLAILGVVGCGKDASNSDYSEFDTLKCKAEQGDAHAQNDLGHCYFKGHGVGRDEVEAVTWWRKAAEQGLAEAQCSLGFCYLDGQGVAKDYAEGVMWMRKAAEQGNAEAQSNLGSCYSTGRGVDKDEFEAVRWRRKAAEQGEVKSQFIIGTNYAGGQGVEKDEVEAVKWVRKAAEQGLAVAQATLGFWYCEGRGVAKDAVEAVKWMRKAAEQGLAVAQSFLGQCYKDGFGTKKDYIEAAIWLRKAAEQGDEQAKEDLKGMAEKVEFARALKDLENKCNRRLGQRGIRCSTEIFEGSLGLGNNSIRTFGRLDVSIDCPKCNKTLTRSVFAELLENQEFEFIGSLKVDGGKTKCDDCGYWVPFDVPLKDILK